MTAGIDPDVAPSGPGCVECEAAGGWWVHLRRCAQCGHIGCCDSSPNQHARAHATSTGHPVIRSFEPGEDWFWDFTRSVGVVGPRAMSFASVLVAIAVTSFAESFALVEGGWMLLVVCAVKAARDMSWRDALAAGRAPGQPEHDQLG